MLISRRVSAVNPRLGTYFSIFASAFVAAFFVSLIVEHLGLSDLSGRWSLFLVPVLLYIAIGAMVKTEEPVEYFAAGRRVPAGYTGLLIATTSLGATGIVAMTGVFFFSGFDALCVYIGGLSGLVLMSVLLAPFYRKFGAFTVPSYLGKRFESRALRLTAASISAVPLLLLLTAEVTMGAAFTRYLTGLPQVAAVAVVVTVVVLATVLGGARSLTWAASAQSIGLILALFIPIAVVAVLITSLPFPQLTHGPLVRNLVRNEVVSGLVAVTAPALDFSFPGQALTTLSKPYTLPFGHVGPIAFAMAAVIFAFGIASAPWILPRVVATPGVYESRKSLGWATVFFGLILLTVSAAAVFMRDGLLDLVMSERVGQPPAWLEAVTRAGFADIRIGTGAYAYPSLPFYRDGVLFSLPVAVGLPLTFVYLAMAGAIAAALAAASASIVALGAILSEDVITGLNADMADSKLRIWIARAALPLVALAGGLIALFAPTDPLMLLFWALAISGAAFFPVLVLSIWWKRITAYGAIAGLFAGFAVSSLAILLSEAQFIEVSSAISGVIGIPASIAASLIVSIFSPTPGREALESVRDLRVPGGEVISDREARLNRLKSRTRPN